MSWFTEIAGKAEQMLEILDKNAAAALTSDKINSVPNISIPMEPEETNENIVSVTTSTFESNNEPSVNNVTSSPKKSALSQLRRSNIMKATRRKPPQDEDKQLITYLNGSTSYEANDKPTEITSDNNHDNVQHFKVENTFLKSEIQSLNFEIQRLLQKAKQGEKDQAELITSQARVAELESSLHVVRNESQRLEKELKELQALKSESHFELSSEIERITKKLKENEAKLSSLAETHARVEKEPTELLSELNELKDNFEKYRTRAQSVLNEKDNLIARLRTGSLEDEPAEQLENEEIVLLRYTKG